MNVSLTPALTKLVTEKVKNGRYTSASEVIREALRLLEEQDKIKLLEEQYIREQVILGVKQFETGQYGTYSNTEDLFEEIVREGRKKLKLMNTNSKNVKNFKPSKK